MKFVRAESRPLGDSGLKDSGKAEANDFSPAATRGGYEAVDTSEAHKEHLLSYVDIDSLKPLKIVCMAGNGGVGRVVDLLEPHLL